MVKKYSQISKLIKIEFKPMCCNTRVSNAPQIISALVFCAGFFYNRIFHIIFIISEFSLACFLFLRSLIKGRELKLTEYDSIFQSFDIHIIGTS